ncbi:MAG TPA: 6,7-dimethyl-8-ribityllumazine synthase [Steroidobacteraceae bacterium]|nr:6,7-dimethyl-8-ribityllumazine synthase [Steroidobacteraceae bacterium]
MRGVSVIEGDLDAAGLRITIVAARFNESIVERLLGGAVETLLQHGAAPSALSIVRVPGAFDLPVIARKVAEAGRPDAIIAVGAVIRGETAHFNYVAGECASGLARIADDTGIPIAFGVLTTDSVEQAEERAGGGEGNRGADAALAAIRLATLIRKLGQRP